LEKLYWSNEVVKGLDGLDIEAFLYFNHVSNAVEHPENITAQLRRDITIFRREISDKINKVIEQIHKELTE
jgi:hypothetical protein